MKIRSSVRVGPLDVTDAVNIGTCMRNFDRSRQGTSDNVPELSEIYQWHRGRSDRVGQESRRACTSLATPSSSSVLDAAEDDYLVDGWMDLCAPRSSHRCGACPQAVRLTSPPMENVERRTTHCQDQHQHQPLGTTPIVFLGAGARVRGRAGTLRVLDRYARISRAVPRNVVSCRVA